MVQKYEVLSLTVCSEVGGKDAIEVFAVHQGNARNICYPVSNAHGFLYAHFFYFVPR